MRRNSGIDWEAIEREFRVGQLSIRAIARLYSCTHQTITARAKSKGWTRDLTNQVQVAVNRKLIEESAGSPTLADGSQPRVNDKEIIEAAADRALAVIQCHRKDLKKLRGIVGNLMDRLVVKPLPGAAQVAPGQAGTLPDGITGKEAAELVKSISYALSRAVPLERQAFNLDRAAGDENDPDSIIIEFSRDAAKPKA